MQSINNHSTLNIASGAFRAILLEAEKTVVNAPGGPEGAEAVPESSIPPGADDPLKPSKIKVEGASQKPKAELGSKECLELCEARAKKLGFAGLSDFMAKIAEHCSKNGLLQKGEAAPIGTIAMALLSTDALASLDSPQGTQLGMFEEFELLTSDGGEGLVKTETVQVVKNGSDAQKLVEVGAALAKLTSAGRLEESQVYAYANSRLCDIHSVDDMAAAARTCIDTMHQKLESSLMLQTARAEIQKLRTPAPGEEKPSVENLLKAEKLEKAIEAYCKKIDAIFPRDIVATTHTWGRRKGNALENETLFLEAQANKLTDWLKATYGNPPNIKLLNEAELGLSQALVTIVGLPAEELPPAEGDPDRGGPVTKFVTEDLRKQVQVLRNQVKLANALADDAAVRREQELALTRFAQNNGGRLLPQQYTIDLHASGGVLFGISASTNLRVGGGVTYQMKISVDHAGKVTVLSVKGPKGEISVGTGIGGADASFGLTGGAQFGKALIYDNVQEFLKNSSTDLRVRLHAGGYFHFGNDLSVLSRKVDNTTFAALLKESGVINKTDEFVPKQQSKSVKDKILVEQEHLTGTGSAQGGQHLASGHAELKFTTVRQTQVTSTPRYANLKSVEDLGAARKLVRILDSGTTPPAEMAQSLADEYADFVQAVRYDAWQRSWRLRKFLNRHTAHIEPPKMSLAEHMKRRLPEVPEKDIGTDNFKAAYLASLAATGVAIRQRLEAAPATEANKAALATLEKLQADVLQPEFKIGVSSRRKWLYNTTTTDLGRTVNIGGNVTANANLHLPVVNLLGADLLGGLAPGVKLGVNYQHRLSSEKTGLPHMDQDRLDITIGTNGIKAERIITALLTNILERAGAKNTAVSTGLAVVSPLASPAISVATNLVTGNTGAPIDPNDRFKDTKIDVDAIMAKVGVHVGGDSGVGIRLQLVKSEDGWKFESVQSVNYSELSVDATVSIMSPVGIGGYVSVGGAYGSTNVMSERLYGNSLTPFMRVAGEFNLNSLNMKETSWNAFLDHNTAGLQELAQGLKGFAQNEAQDTTVSKELMSYVKLAEKFRSEKDRQLARLLKEQAKALAGATTPEARKAAATELFRTLGKISAQQLKEHPVVKGGSKVALSEEDLKAMKIHEEMDKEFDVNIEDENVIV